MLSRIRNNIAIKTGALALSLVVIVLAVEAWRGYEQSRDSLHAKFQQERVFLTSTTAHSLSLPLYEYDLDVIENIVAALSDHQDVASVSIIEFNGSELTGIRGHETASEVVMEEAPILSPSYGEIGNLHVTFTMDRINAELHAELVAVLIRIGIILVLISAIIGWAIWSIVRPVTRLEEIVRAYNGRNWPDTVPGIKRQDELGSLARSFHAMALQLKNLLSDLERRVDERTEELKTALEQAKAASNAKSSFLANMSHEIRTPMNGVLGMSEQLMNTPLTGRQKLYADTIYKSGTSLLTLINDILDFSKVESGKLELDPAPFDLKAAIEDVVSLLRMRAQEKGLDINLHVDADLPEMMVGDVGRIRQIITNLVGNAIKFTEKGHVRITASGDVDDGVCRCRIEVEDTGIGISSDKTAEIFEEFSQAEQSTTRQFGGTGLGLAISQRLADLMDGQVGVVSSLGYGSTFWLELPLPVHEVAGVPSARTELSGGVRHSSDRTLSHLSEPGRRLRVLAVEDNEVNRLVLGAILDKQPMDVTFAVNGLEACEQVEAQKFDAILMDLSMPVMDGYEATGRIRRHERAEGRERTPIICLTAHALKGQEQICRDHEMDDYLTKPVRQEDVLKALSRWTGQDSEEDTMPLSVADRA